MLEACLLTAYEMDWTEGQIKYDLEDKLWVKSHFDYNKLAYNYVLLTYFPDIYVGKFDEDYVVSVLIA